MFMATRIVLCAMSLNDTSYVATQFFRAPSQHLRKESIRLVLLGVEIVDESAADAPNGRLTSRGALPGAAPAIARAAPNPWAAGLHAPLLLPKLERPGLGESSLPRSRSAAETDSEPRSCSCCFRPLLPGA